jgi:hypothetical protein
MKFKLFKKNGYYQNKFKVDAEFKEFADYITKFQLDSKYDFKEKLGYSNPIYKYINPKYKEYLNRFLKKFINENKFINKILFLPRYTNIEIYKSYYNIEAKENPTHAMLWHRDYDDFFPQVRIFIPLSLTNKKNGALQYVDKNICKQNVLLSDVQLNKTIDKNDEYKSTNSVRVSKKTFEKYFKKNIKEFNGDIGDCLFIDTNSCYHRGGQVLEEKCSRNMLVLYFGGITHTNNDLSKYSFFEKIIYHSIKFFFRFKHKITGGKYIKKINLK